MIVFHLWAWEILNRRVHLKAISSHWKTKALDDVQEVEANFDASSRTFCNWNYCSSVGFEVLTEMVVQSFVLGYNAVLSLKFNWHFGATCSFHLQGFACCLLHASFLLGLLFNHEDGGDMFLRNIGWLSTDYAALYPRGRHPALLNLFGYSLCRWSYG
jgi:hypothetical protein